MKELRIGDEMSITHREGESLRRYLNELDRTHLIPAEEEARLAEKIRSGDKAAEDKLVGANLRFVVSVAKKYQGNGLPLAELVAEGNVGLIRAAKRFDERKGFKFISFAVWWIRDAIMTALGNTSRMIRLPLSIVRTTTDIRRKAERMEQQLERMPTMEEIAEELGLTDDNPALEHSFGWNMFSYDIPMVGKDGSEDVFSSGLMDTEGEPTDQIMMEESMQILVQRTLSVLAERERTIIKLFYGIGCERPLSMVEIGERLDLNQERIRQIHHGAIKKIQQMAKRNGSWYHNN